MMKKSLEISKNEKKETREESPKASSHKTPSRLPFREVFSSSKRARILILDDHPIIRRGIADYINAEADMMICGEAEDAHQVLTMMSTAKPDLIIVDISLNGSSGIEFLAPGRTLDPHFLVWRSTSASFSRCITFLVLAPSM